MPPTYARNARDVNEAAAVVRRATSEDWSVLRAIRLEALADTPDAFGSTYDATLTLTSEQWRTMARERCYFLTERDERVVAMASGGLHDQYPGTHWLYSMYVTPSQRGTSTAPALVEAVVSWARGAGAGELYLEVNSSNARARAFYHKMGFLAVGDRRPMSRDEIHELLTMRREIRGE